MTRRSDPVLVTGGAGWIGSRLVDRLRRDHPEVEALAPGRAQLDCADPVAVAAALTRRRPRVVVHLAGCVDRGADPASVGRQWRDTFAAGRVVVEAASAAGVRHVVIAGTMDELGDRSGVISAEQAPRPLTAYGLCKALVREVAAFTARRDPGLRVDWARPTTVYGPGQTGTMLVPYACASAVAGSEATFTPGLQRRDFLYVDDLIDWFALAAAGPVDEAGARGLHDHHLGSGVAVPVRNVLTLIAAEFPASRFAIGARPAPPHEPPVQTVPAYRDDDPVLGSWQPGTRLADGIAATASWWRARPDVGERPGAQAV